MSQENVGFMLKGYKIQTLVRFHLQRWWWNDSEIRVQTVIIPLWPVNSWAITGTLLNSTVNKALQYRAAALHWIFLRLWIIIILQSHFCDFEYISTFCVICKCRVMTYHKSVKNNVQFWFSWSSAGALTHTRIIIWLWSECLYLLYTPTLFAFL